MSYQVFSLQNIWNTRTSWIFLTLNHALCMIILLLVSCSKNEYVNVIPKDATVVLSANVKTMAEEAGLAESQFIDQFKAILRGVVDSKTAAQLQEYIDNPERMGIDFREPVYYFTAGNTSALTMAVYDRGDLEKMLSMLKDQGLCSNITDGDGFKSVILMDEACVAFDKSTILVLYLDKGQSRSYARQTCKQLFGLEKSQSFLSTVAYSDMEQAGQELMLYADMAAMPSDILQNVKSLLPEGVRYPEISILSAMRFEKGKAVLSVNMRGKTKEVQKKLEKGNGKLKKIDGEFIESPMDNFALWACAGVEKGALLDILRQNSKYKEYLLLLERAIDIEQIVREVDGDVSLTIPQGYLSVSDTVQFPQFLLMAEIDDDDFLKDVDYWRKSMRDYGMSMTKTIGQNYVLSLGSSTINWGVDDDNIYFASAQTFAQNSASQRSGLLLPLKNDIKSSLFYLYLNMQGDNNNRTPLRSIILQSKSFDKMECAVNLDDDTENFLKILFTHIPELIGDKAPLPF